MWMTRVSINNPVFATMVMVALCVLGLFAFNRLGVEQMPEISLPGAWIDVRYPGAGPDAVEREVAKTLEEAVNTIAGVKRIQSRSFEGRAQMSVEFTLDTNMDRAMQDLRDRVALAQAAFPRDVKPPMINRFQEGNQPVMVAALISPNRSLRELSLMAEQTVVKRIQRAEGVAVVGLSGQASREVRIDLDPQRLRAYGVTVAEIAQALREANGDQAIGLLSDRQLESALRLEGRIKDPRAFNYVVVARRGNLALTLGDLGVLSEREREPDSLSRIDGKPAITFNVFKQQDANVVKAGEAVKEALADLRKTLPADVELREIWASSDFVKGSLDGLKHTLIEGALLTIAIVFLFLHSWRSTVITGLTLPIAVISSFIAVYAFGFTLNFMTMMALSLVIGLLIDDAIVVRENIVRHVAMGKSHRQAAFDGTNEIGLAVLATTFAICAVFVPVAFMGGVIGKFFYPFGITVAVAVLVSLFVSFTLDPMLSAVWHDPGAAPMRRWRVVGPAIGWLLDTSDRMMDALHRVYERSIRWALGTKRYRVFVPPIPVYARPFDAENRRDKTQARRWRLATLTPRGLVMWGATASFVVAIGLAGVVGSEFVPETDQGFTQINLRMPTGSSLERTNAKVLQVEAIVAAMPEVKTISTTVGASGEGFATGRAQASLQIALKDKRERKRSQKEFEAEVRKAIEQVAGVELSVGWGKPIYVAILGNDSEALARVAEEFAAKLRKVKGAVDVETTSKPGLPAYAVRLKDSAARELGLTAPQLANALRTYVNGDAATFWTAPDGAQVEVNLRLPKEMRERVDQMAKLPVAYARDGSPIALDQVATIEPVFNPEVIRRQNLQRREAIIAGVNGASVGEVSAAVDKLIKETELPPGLSFDIGGQSKEQAEAFSGLLQAMALAAIFIYIVLASQFGSFIQPLAIMASLPLALIGVMLALLLWNSTLNVFSMIGLVMLMGLVTKNAILLVDRANQMRKAGLSVVEALVEAGLTRMRPIVMTTAAMVFGMLPLALALNDGGEIQAPMGRAIIGGVITSTLLTLVVVPVLYSYLVRGKKAVSAADLNQPVSLGLSPADDK
ncbi:multidrug efflux pump subunit AcrB [Inhella inkyongensis]|uniref:Multidrug efflux pump subunit AcrB n=1 Tax=Inhella inkyongensis TaxID=392593 RepID=A0A840SAP6_9BURK|nr:efflux RND transporter permease subunit [Inhella inkyongensis]MBB5205459.1 multidrug efflux pump subunit AcrB [Inhella inkyongensis]